MTSNPDSTLMIFVGRQEELLLLRHQFDRACQEGSRLVLIAGPAGGGKTALIRRFAGEFGNVQAFLEGRGWDNRAAVPYHALREVLLQLRARQPGLIEAHPYLSAFLENQGEIPSSPPVNLFFQALAQLLSAAAGPASCIFLDDLHWADEGTFEWLDFALRELAAAPILWIGAYRSEERQALARLLDRREQWARASRFHELELPPLDPAAIEAWSRQAVPPEQWHADLPGRIWSRSQGLPLLAGEEIRLYCQGQEFFSCGQALINRRLSRLSADERELLTLAAVMGERFSLESLAALWGAPLWETARALSGLAAEEGLLQADGEAFRFAHNRYREALLERLSAPLRQVYHDRVARLSVPVPAEERVYHLVGAGQVGPGIEALIAQGERAVQLRDWHDALRYYLEAQGLAAQGAFPEVRAALYTHLGDLYLLLIREPEIAQGYYAAALRWTAAPREKLRLLCRLAEVNRSASLSQARHYLEETLHLGEQIGEDPIRGWVLCLQAEQAIVQADIPWAHQLARQALAWQDHLPADVVSRLQSLLLTVAGIWRDRQEIERYARAADFLSLDPWQAAQQWQDVARAYMEAGYPRQVLAYLEKAEGAYIRLSWDRETTQIRGFMGLAALNMGAWTEARQYLEQALRAAAPDPVASFQARINQCRTWVYDYTPEGLSWAEKALETLVSIFLKNPRDDLSLGKHLHLLGPVERIFRDRGRAEEFKERLETCRKRLQDAGYQAAGTWYFSEPQSLPEPTQAAQTGTWNWHPGHQEATWTQGEELLLSTQPLRGFYQMNMPRLLRPVSGDFVLQATLASAEEVVDDLLGSRRLAAEDQHAARVRGGGGLLLMYNRRDALRLFVHLREPGEVICTVRQQEQDRFLGRGLLGKGPIQLRLERRGHTLTAYAGHPGNTWYLCAQVELPGWNSGEAGIFAECLVDLYALVDKAETGFRDLYLDTLSPPFPPASVEDERPFPRPAWQPDPELCDFVAQGGKMRQLVAQIRHLAAEDAPVLIQGETGTGKELVARALHQLGPRYHGPFVPVNCAAIPPELMERELFGHVRGAFTGAYESRGGLFETADGGVLFLDEISEAAPQFQVRLLRVIEEQAVRRVGDPRLKQVDVRIVAATNQNLRQGVSKGTFRQDLFFRLTAYCLEPPPLRQRREEIPYLVYFILDRWSSRHQCEAPLVSRQAMASLVNNAWPGNVRELIHEVESAAAHAEDRCIRSCHLSIQPTASSHLPFASPVTAEFTRIQDALRHCHGNRSEAARRLGISRVTLYRKMRKWGLIDPAGC